MAKSGPQIKREITNIGWDIEKLTAYVVGIRNEGFEDLKPCTITIVEIAADRKAKTTKGK